MQAKPIASTATASSKWVDDEEFLHGRQKEEKEIIETLFDIYEEFMETIEDIWFEEAARERNWIQDIELPYLTREIPKKFRRQKNKDPMAKVNIAIYYDDHIYNVTPYKKRIVVRGSDGTTQLFGNFYSEQAFLKEWEKKNGTSKKMYAWEQKSKK